MSEIPEKIDNSNNELQKIETKISDVSKKLDYLRKSWKDDELALAQIQELELALKYLENQKAEIIWVTQSKLPDVNKKDLNTNLTNSWLNQEQQQKVKANMDDWKFSIESFLEQNDLWILWIILKVFAWIMGWFKTYNEVWEDWKELEDTIINYSKITDKDKKEYVKSASVIAKKIEKEYWIPWEVTVSQSILESWWWNSGLAKKHWNYFGIKSFWKWQSVEMSTTEEINWKQVKIKDWFKVFKNMEESFYWYAEFLTKNPRYREAFAYWYDIQPRPDYYPKIYIWLDSSQFAKEISKRWYATDSKYSAKVNSISNRVREIV